MLLRGLGRFLALVINATFLASFAVHAAGTCGTSDSKKSIAFAIDTTGSMGDKIQAAEQAARNILNTVLNMPGGGNIQNFVLAPFNDPTWGPVTNTDDVNVFLNALGALTAGGGDDCPELAMHGVQDALNNVLPRSMVFILTDASAKDYDMEGTILNLVQESQSQLFYILCPGECSGTVDPGYTVYVDTASASNGHVFEVDVTDISSVINYIMTQIHNVPIDALDLPNGPNTLSFPVDSHLSGFTVTVTGTTPQLTIYDPNGQMVNTYTVIVSLPNALVYEVKNPQVGTWQITTNANGAYSLTVNGLGSIDFCYGFSENSDNFNPMYRPIAGLSSYIFSQFADLNSPGKPSILKIVDTAGNVIQSQPIAASTISTWPYISGPVIPPNNLFRIKAEGTDETGASFRRITATAITPDTNPCELNPCGSNGVCTQQSSTSYTCTCNPGYTGTNCDKYNYCQSSPCENDGTCVNQPTGFTCQCPEPYYGADCSTADPCLPNNNCQNGATCVRQSNTAYQCLCAPGYLDQYCQTVDYCYSNPCSNDGTCFNEPMQFNCSCTAQFWGPQCQYVDQCLSSPCVNGGTCVNQPEGYQCSCLHGYAGQDCQINLCYGDFVYVVDTSDSICETELVGSYCPYFANMQEFLVNLTDSFVVGPKDSHFALVHFSDPSKTAVSFPLDHFDTNSDVDASLTSLNYWELSGDTDTGDALKLVRDTVLTTDNGDRVGAPNIVILFTDGNWDIGPDPVKVADDLWSRNDTFLFAVGIGDLISKDKLLQLVRSDDHIYNVSGYLSLGDTLKDQLLKGTNCGRPHDDYCRENSCQNGATCVNQPNTFTCVCQPGFTGASCEQSVPCLINPCLNGGTCIDNSGEASCICEPSFLGQYCDTANPCGNVPCTVAPDTATPGFYGHCVIPGNSLDCTDLPDGNYNDPQNPCAMHYYSCWAGIAMEMSCPTETFYDCTADECLQKLDVLACD